MCSVNDDLYGILWMVVVYLVVNLTYELSDGFEAKSSTSALIDDDSLPDLITRKNLLQYLLDFFRSNGRGV